MINISSKSDGVAGRLSNFTSRLFFFDGVPCASLEGPIQAVKFEDPEIQREICMLSGREAKLRGREKNESWQATQILWWLGEKVPRDSVKYQERLDRLYDAVAQLSEFQTELLATGNEILCHTVGEKDPRKTVMTEEEFCSRLMRKREELRKNLVEWTVMEIDAAATMIEKDGTEAFQRVSELYGEKVATILIVAHIRRSLGSMRTYPPEVSISKMVNEKMKRLCG